VTAPSRPRRPAPPVVAPVGPRLAARVRAERAGRRRTWRRRLRRLLLVLLPVAALGWVLLLSPLLAVDRVQVTGTGRLSAEQVGEVAAVQLGTPLARVDAGATAARVRTLEPVADVRVKRVWPATVRIDVTERVPVSGALVGRDGADGVLLVDAAGVGFATEPALPPGLPRLEVAQPGPDDPTTRAALRVLLELPADLGSQVAVVRASTPSDVSLVLGDGRTVVWGAPGSSAEDTATRAAAVTALLRMPGSEFDVSAPGVAVRR
jgi:cell division protein FtsQ